MDKAYWEQCYTRQPGDIPWEIEELPTELSRWIASGIIESGATVLDVGCGTGNYAIELARRGFTVSALDISERAISIARERARSSGITVDFQVASVLEWHPTRSYDFVYDYSVFHHIEEAERSKYVRNIAAAVKPDKFFGVVCYSDGDPDAKGGKSRVGDFGNTIYHPTREELRAVFSPVFVEIAYTPARLGRRLHHLAHCVTFQRAAR